MRRLLKRYLVARFFVSYMVVILVCVAALAAAAEFAVPRAFDRHLAAMGSMMQNVGGMMEETSADADLNVDLFRGFQAAFTEALTLAAVVALLTAVLVSLVLSRQVVAPIQAMTRASARIAEGQYQDRVAVRGDVSTDDLDELAQLALSFNRMAAKLSQTEAMRRQLIADVAHELRTPLTATKGYLEGLMDGVLPPTPETYQQIHSEATRLQHLVDDLQELSRVEARAYELHLAPISPAKLIDDAVRRMQYQFEEKEVTLAVEPQPDQPLVLADEGRMQQVLTNLLGNALQYTPSGERVTVRTEAVRGEVRFFVQDTGIGVPAEHLPHLFDRFYRVEPSRSRAHGGSGIGLTIAKHLVEAHGGRIWAESAGKDRGSTFGFTLPVAQPLPKL
ncbi:MAG TPA: ATP-binding protein [Anaerolineae bacterium]|nr:ATP-binding protein [Anaerolineae bacterium]